MQTIISEVASDTRDFLLGSAPILLGLAGVLAVVILPLWWIARSMGVV